MGAQIPAEVSCPYMPCVEYIEYHCYSYDYITYITLLHVHAILCPIWLRSVNAHEGLVARALMEGAAGAHFYVFMFIYECSILYTNLYISTTTSLCHIWLCQ